MTARPDVDSMLDEQLCFALYSASRAMTGAYRDRLAKLDLTYTQFVVLLLLWEHHCMPMGQLGERLHLDSATLSPVLKRMADRRLVTRSRSSEDERVVEITCTDDGYALREPVRAVQSEVREITGLPRAEVVGMRDDLLRLAERIRRESAASSAR
jgi:MarR family transcriptional regulator, organic hydroperoxide resistance regulator